MISLMKNKTKQLIAFLTLTAVTALSVQNPFASASPAQKDPPAVFQPLEVENLKISKELGSVETFWRGTGAQTVIILQDAHSNPDAQKKLQKLIRYFQKNFRIRRAALEGSAGPVDTEFLRSFPDSKRLRQALREPFQKGELSAGVLASLFPDKNLPEIDFYGAEDWALYESGLALYLRAVSHQAEILKTVESWRARLQSRKQKLFSPELLEIDRLFENFSHQPDGLMVLLDHLASIQPPDPQSEIGLLLAEHRGAAGDSKILEKEVRNLAGKFQGILDSRGHVLHKKEALNFQRQYQKFLTSEISPQAMALVLEKTLKVFQQSGQTEFTITPELRRRVQEQEKMEAIEGPQFFKVFQQYARSVKQSLLKDEESRALDQESRRCLLTEKMAGLELSRDEWSEFKTLAAVPRTETEIGIFESLKTHKAFYENAEQRDGAFLKTLQAKKENTLLIAGGFHAQGLAERLRERGISYAVILPAVTSAPDGSHYREHMNGNVSWRNYYEIEGGRISVYKAFVRYLRDRLLSQGPSSETPELLKQWRDQIIRNLAEKNKTEKAEDYLRFLDEIKENPAQTAAHEIMANVNHFLDGVLKLESQNRITTQTIYNLLTVSKISAAGSSAAGSPESSVEAVLLGFGDLQDTEPYAAGTEKDKEVSPVRTEMRRKQNKEEAVLSVSGKNLHTFRVSPFKLKGSREWYVESLGGMLVRAIDLSEGELLPDGSNIYRIHLELPPDAPHGTVADFEYPSGYRYTKGVDGLTYLFPGSTAVLTYESFKKSVPVEVISETPKKKTPEKSKGARVPKKTSAAPKVAAAVYLRRNTLNNILQSAKSPISFQQLLSLARERTGVSINPATLRRDLDEDEGDLPRRGPLRQHPKLRSEDRPVSAEKAERLQRPEARSKKGKTEDPDEESLGGFYGQWDESPALKKVEPLKVDAERRARLAGKLPPYYEDNWDKAEQKLGVIRAIFKGEPHVLLDYFERFPFLLTYGEKNLTAKEKILSRLKIPLDQRIRALDDIIRLNNDLLDVIITAAETQKQKISSPDLRRLSEKFEREWRRSQAQRKLKTVSVKETIQNIRFPKDSFEKQNERDVQDALQRTFAPVSAALFRNEAREYEWRRESPEFKHWREGDGKEDWEILQEALIADSEENLFQVMRKYPGKFSTAYFEKNDLAEGRTFYFKLRHPLGDIEELRIKAARPRTAEDGVTVLPYSGTRGRSSGIMGARENGEVGFDDSGIGPFGGMSLEDALKEYDFMESVREAPYDFTTDKALAAGEFKNLKYPSVNHDGSFQRLAFVIAGMTSEDIRLSMYMRENKAVMRVVRFSSGKGFYLNTEDTLKIIEKAGAALREFHDAGYVHRYPHFNNLGADLRWPRKIYLIFRDLNNIFRFKGLPPAAQTSWRFTDFMRMRQYIAKYRGGGVQISEDMLQAFTRGYFRFEWTHGESQEIEALMSPVAGRDFYKFILEQREMNGVFRPWEIPQYRSLWMQLNKIVLRGEEGGEPQGPGRSEMREKRAAPLAPRLADYFVRRASGENERRALAEESEKIIRVRGARGFAADVRMSVSGRIALPRKKAKTTVNFKLRVDAGLGEAFSAKILDNFMKTRRDSESLAVAFHRPGREKILSELLAKDAVKSFISLALISKEMAQIHAEGVALQTVRIERVGLRPNRAAQNPLVAILTEKKMAERPYAYTVRQTGEVFQGEPFFESAAELVEVLAAAVVASSEDAKDKENLKNTAVQKRVKGELLSRLFGEGFLKDKIPEGLFSFDAEGNLKTDRGLLMNLMTEAFASRKMEISA